MVLVTDDSLCPVPRDATDVARLLRLPTGKRFRAVVRRVRGCSRAELWQA